jgi:hypothetical protein
MIKKIFLALVFFSTASLFAQEGTSSPYSYYGLGEVKFNGTHDLRSMGGISVAYDSIHLNLLNPATYSRLRRTNFVIGGTTRYTDISNSTESESAQRTTLDYLAVGFPLGNKFGATFGLMPFSSVGYKIVNQEEATDFTLFNNYTGKGGINRVFTGLAYNITKSLSIGVDLQYNFGTIETQATVFRSDLLLGTRELNTGFINGFSANLGLAYKRKVTNNLDIFVSLMHSPEARLTTNNDRNIAVISFSANGNEETRDSRDINITDNNTVLPAKTSAGFGLGKDRKWFVGVEFINQENERLDNRFDNLNNSTFENSNKFILGGYFIPNYNSFSNYWSRVNYRAGVRYGNTGLLIDTKAIKDYGINFGLGLPVGGAFSNINIGFEYGKRGTTSQNLVEENYFGLNIGLSLSDLWFEKRKYD